MGILSKAFDLVEFFVGSNHRFEAKLGLEDLGFLRVADESGDVERACTGMIEQSGENSASDVPCSTSNEPFKNLNEVDRAYRLHQ